MPDQHHLWLAIVTLLAVALLLLFDRTPKVDKVAKIQWRPETTGSRSRTPAGWRGGPVARGSVRVILALAAVTGLLMFLDILPSWF